MIQIHDWLTEPNLISFTSKILVALNRDKSLNQLLSYADGDDTDSDSKSLWYCRKGNVLKLISYHFLQIAAVNRFSQLNLMAGWKILLQMLLVLCQWPAIIRG